MSTMCDEYEVYGKILDSTADGVKMMCSKYRRRCGITSNLYLHCIFFVRNSQTSTRHLAPANVCAALTRNTREELEVWELDGNIPVLLAGQCQTGCHPWRANLWDEQIRCDTL
jgi:hypothetical protein